MKVQKLSALFIVFLVACNSFYATPQSDSTAISTEQPASTATEAPTNTPEASSTPEPSPTPVEPVVFVAIGDYGQAGNEEFALAEMIDSWQVDFIVTLGDNNYPDGSAETIDENIGQYFHRYIGDYKGEYNRGSEINRFFPSIGNHDWSFNGIEPYLDYFTLPGNERYYDVVWENIHLFVLNSDPQEPDGVGTSSVQAAWFQEVIAASTSKWNVVVFHHAPYSSGSHGSTDWMQWPFADWGVDVVLAGHDHLYERLEVDGVPYFTNGLGGHAAIYNFESILPESKFRYNAEHGALRVTVTNEYMLFEFINIDGELIDSFTLQAD